MEHKSLDTVTRTLAPGELPDRPSALIRVALEDLARIEKTPGYVVNMRRWHEPLGDGHCAVCFAGGVMATRLGLQPDEDFRTTLGKTMILDPVMRKIFALNNLRVGDTSTAFECLGLSEKEGKRFNRGIAHYNAFATAFQADMERLADDLEAAGY